MVPFLLAKEGVAPKSGLTFTAKDPITVVFSIDTAVLKVCSLVHVGTLFPGSFHELHCLRVNGCMYLTQQQRVGKVYVRWLQLPGGGGRGVFGSFKEFFGNVGDAVILVSMGVFSPCLDHCFFCSAAASAGCCCNLYRDVHRVRPAEALVLLSKHSNSAKRPTPLGKPSSYTYVSPIFVYFPDESLPFPPLPLRLLAFRGVSTTPPRQLFKTSLFFNQTNSKMKADILKPKKDITAAFHKYLAVILGERTEAAEDAMFTRKVRCDAVRCDPFHFNRAAAGKRWRERRDTVRDICFIDKNGGEILCIGISSQREREERYRSRHLY